MEGIMRIDCFRSHCIARCSPPAANDYKSYRRFLAEDFKHRCAYCNLHDTRITTPFHIDHFIPRKEFEHLRPDLDTDYNNLIYSCPKCNNAKRDKFQGDLSLPNPTNEMFYDPVNVDYNTIFYRNEIGAIDSDDIKGKEMIKALKLYRPIHILAWICEKLDKQAEQLQLAIIQEEDVIRKEKLREASVKINSQYRKYVNLFTASYNNQMLLENFVYSD